MATVFVWSWACVSSAIAGTKPNAPIAQVDLEAIGFPGFSQMILDAGGSMLTVHFLDDKHLLVTFATRGLIRRNGDDEGGDSRLVAAKLLELPSGKVVAETEWRLHDHGRYLWNLGDGRFLLRDHNALSTFTPLANLDRPFERTFLAHREGDLQLVAVSADFKVLTIETAESKSVRRGDIASGVRSTPAGDDDDGQALPPRPVLVEFLRYSGSGTPDEPLSFQKAGVVRSPHAVLLPVDSDGYLHTEGPDSSFSWTVDYRPFAGKRIVLAPVESSCPPELWTAARGFALAVGCRGNSGRVKLFALDFDKHELWEEPLATPALSFAFAFAPSSRRFALSYVQSVTGSLTANVTDPTATQEVRVYQAQTGDLLLKVDCAPVVRTEENFDLSSDGLRLAVVRQGTIAIYSLQNLQASDRADFATMDKFTPPSGTGPIRLTALEVAKEEPAPAAAMDREKPRQASGAATANAAPATDTDDATPRKPPTLLNPGEKPE